MDWERVECTLCGMMVDLPAPSDWDLSPKTECPNCGTEVK